VSSPLAPLHANGMHARPPLKYDTELTSALRGGNPFASGGSFFSPPMRDCLPGRLYREDEGVKGGG